MKNYLIYIVYGKEKYFLQTVFSIFSFLKFNKNENIEIVILTDNREYFVDLVDFNITFVDISKEKNEIEKTHSYLHELKPLCLRKFYLKNKGNYLFIDTDTYILKNISSLYVNIENNNLLLHKNEGRIKNNNLEFTRIYDKKLKILDAFFEKDKKFIYNNKIEMWNSGVIGFNYNNSYLIEKAIFFLNNLIGKIDIFTIEQFAISYTFNKSKFKLLETEDFIYHYWGFVEFDEILNLFFKKNSKNSIIQKIENMDSISPVYLEKRRRNYINSSIIKKAFIYFTTGKRWSVPRYDIKS